MRNKKYSAKSLIVKCLFIVVGLSIAASSTPFLVYANLGGDPFTAYNQGFSGTTGLSYGMSVNILNGAVLILVLILDRKMIHLGTLFYLCLLGPLSDLFLGVFSFIDTDALSLPLRVAMMLVGIFCVGFGLGIYQASRLGAGPTDAFNQIMSKKLKIKLRTERIVYDAVLLCAAFFLGGTINIGTVLGIICIGPIMAPTINQFTKVINRITNTENAA